MGGTNLVGTSTKLGLFVLPGSLTQIMKVKYKLCYGLPCHHCFIPAGQHIVQLVPFSSKTPSGKGKGGTNNFGSTGQLQVFWTSSITTAQPILTCSIDGKRFKGLVDTGTHVSIIKSSE